MLRFILLMSLLCQGHAIDHGMEFITAFPENLAYYYPVALCLKLKITTFQNPTQVTVSMNGTGVFNGTIPAMSVTMVDVPNAEINQLGISWNSIRITSDSNITVISYNKRGDSIQANMVPPTTYLGTDYMVPSPNYTELAVSKNSYNVSQFASTTAEPMDFSMRLLILNAEAVSNSITVDNKSPTGLTTETINLDPYALILLPSDSFWYEIKASGKVAVIITNPCMDSYDCRCNLIAHQLRPINLFGTSFIFPSYDSTDKRLFVTSSQSLDLTSGANTKTVDPASIGLLPFISDPKAGGLQTSQPASVRVILPGLFIDLLPTSMFAGCFLVQINDQTKDKVLIIVKTAEKDSIQMGNNPISLGSATWTPLDDVEYSWVVISLSQPSSVIWHPTSPIAVYVLGTSESGVTYGGPAISINNEPDPNGCVVVPMTFELSNTTMSWQEARAHCISQNMVMASPNINYTQGKMMTSLSDMGVEGGAWLGLRRSLINADWYWHSAMNFDYDYWDYNQPSSNLCGSIKMAAGGNYTWSSERCCSSMFPLCAQNMTVISTITDTNIPVSC